MLTTVWGRISGLMSAKLGRCSRCMRLSLKAALVGWAAAAVAYQIQPDGWMRTVALVFAVPFTVLWVGHVTAFATRTLLRERGAQEEGPRRHVPMIYDRRSGTSTRRHALTILASGAVLGVLASLPVPAFAYCNSDRCSSGYCECRTNACQGGGCCPSNYPLLNLCDCQCYNSSDFDCSSYVNCNY